MSDQSTHSDETSKPKSPFGKKEIDYLTRVEAAMLPPTPTGGTGCGAAKTLSYFRTTQSRTRSRRCVR
jgi:hypothetical protein